MNATSIETLLLTVTTLCAAIMIGVGFLPHPSRHAAIWSSAFVCALVATYLNLAVAGGLEWVRAGAGGLGLLTLGLVWVGIRVHARRARSLLIPVIAGGVVATLALALLGAAGATTVVIAHIVSAAVGATLLAATVVELAMTRAAARSSLLPLMVGAGVGFAFTVLWLLTVALNPGAEAVVDPTTTIPSLGSNMVDGVVVAIVYLVTALVTLVLLALPDAVPAELESNGAFDCIANERLARAQHADDTWWSVLDVRLDETLALREASSALAFARVVDRFALNVTETMPAEADLHRVDPTRFLVLLPRHDSAVRPILRTLLDRVSTVSEGQFAALRLSTSVGWSNVAVCGWDLEALTLAAGDACDAAQRAGGDRWERALVAV